MSTAVKDVAIIGAGLGGCALAIALHRQGIPVRVFEYRDGEREVLSSGVLLHPNALVLLDKLDILKRVQKYCYKLTEMLYSDSDGKPVRVQAMGAEKDWGYDIHRIYRIVLLREMKAMLNEFNVPIVYNSKFERIVEETAKGVSFVVGGRIEQASFLVGADGIHSIVRRHLTDHEPQYTGHMIVAAHIPSDAVDWPSPDYNRTVTFMGKNGSLIMVPEVPDASDLIVGIQIEYPHVGRKGWDELAKDRPKLIELFTGVSDAWGKTPKSVVDSVVDSIATYREEKIIVWPMHKLPTLDSWSSGQARVVVIGDAAHTLPPSSGQGVNQAIEDAYTLAYLLGHASCDTNLGEMSAFWRQWRLKRIEYILKMTAMTDAMRASPAVRARLEAEGRTGDVILNAEEIRDLLAKIYLPKVDEDMSSWLSAHTKSATV